jgi:hypothetical protein
MTGPHVFVVVARDGTPLGVFGNLADARQYRNTGSGTMGADVFQVPSNPGQYNPDPRPTPLPRR